MKSTAKKLKALKRNSGGPAGREPDRETRAGPGSGPATSFLEPPPGPLRKGPQTDALFSFSAFYFFLSLAGGPSHENCMQFPAPWGPENCTGGGQATHGAGELHGGYVGSFVEAKPPLAIFHIKRMNVHCLTGWPPSPAKCPILHFSYAQGFQK